MRTSKVPRPEVSISERLADLIRSGKAPDVICRKGAEGQLPVSVEEQTEILMLLATRAEGPWRDKARQTLCRWDGVEVARVAASPQSPPEVLHFAAEQVGAGHEELRLVLLGNPNLPEGVRRALQYSSVPLAATEAVAAEASGPSPSESVAPSFEPGSAPDSAAPTGGGPSDDSVANELEMAILAKLVAGETAEDPAGAPIEIPVEVTKHDDELTPNDRETLIQKVNRMTVVEKIKAALTGNMETRGLLIRDANKIISRAVLQSPKISESEAEGYAAAKNVSEEVLRLIAMNRKFMKAYVVMRALTNNPRAPITITLPLLNRLNDRDLKGVALNRNIPDMLRSTAAKRIKQKEDASKPKLPGKH